jgi:hypothetical protein
LAAEAHNKTTANDALARKYLNEVSRAFGDNNHTFLLLEQLG